MIGINKNLNFIFLIIIYIIKYILHTTKIGSKKLPILYIDERKVRQKFRKADK